VLAPLRQSQILAPCQGPTFWMLDLPGRAKVTAEQTGGVFNLIEAVCPVGYATPLHIHYLEDETVYVLEGCVTFFLGGRQETARPGSTVYQPRGIAHGFRVDGEAPARILALSAPAGKNQAGLLDNGSASPLGWAPLELETLADLAAWHKIDVLGPLPASDPS
jgi:quercetin dioxygenase-like cupin family protein